MRILVVNAGSSSLKLRLIGPGDEMLAEHDLHTPRARIDADELDAIVASLREVLDPEDDFSAASGMIPPTIGGPADMIGERAVETAITTGARVTALASSASQALRDAGGIVALLRY